MTTLVKLQSNPHLDNFETVGAALQHASYQVAIFWLSYASRTLAAGGTPNKLSDVGYQLAELEFERLCQLSGLVRHFYKHRGTRSAMLKHDARISIKHGAIRIALAKLHVGQFPSVAAHFGVDVPESDVLRQSHSLLRSHES